MQTTFNTATADPAVKLWLSYEAVYSRLHAHHKQFRKIDHDYAEREHEIGDAVISAMAQMQPKSLNGIAAVLLAAKEYATMVRDWIEEGEDEERQCLAIQCIDNAIAGLEAMGATVPR